MFAHSEGGVNAKSELGSYVDSEAQEGHRNHP